MSFPVGFSFPTAGEGEKPLISCLKQRETKKQRGLQNSEEENVFFKRA